MNKDNSYNVFSPDSKPEFSVVELPEKVLGGDDAMNFTNAMQEVDESKTKFVIADLAGVKVMNSSGLGMLVGALRSLQKRNISLVLVSIPSIVDSLLQMTHLYKVFKIFDSVEDAVNNLE